jgi:CII-binding regulator of phage lambda lysogenization HflD
MNNRTAIRSALTTLLSGETSAGTNVYANRYTSLWQSELPAILIYTRQESAVPEAMNQSRYIRTLELSIEVRVEASEDVDDSIDSIIGEIEDQLATDQSIGGTVLSSTQTNTEIRVDSDGEKDIGVGILTLECKYIS